MYFIFTHPYSLNLIKIIEYILHYIFTNAKYRNSCVTLWSIFVVFHYHSCIIYRRFPEAGNQLHWRSPRTQPTKGNIKDNDRRWHRRCSKSGIQRLIWLRVCSLLRLSWYTKHNDSGALILRNKGQIHNLLSTN